MDACATWFEMIDEIRREIREDGKKRGLLGEELERFVTVEINRQRPKG